MRHIALRLDLPWDSVTKKAPPASNKPDRLSEALDVLREILKDASNNNRRYSAFCKVSMRVPIEIRKEDCAWRRAWQLVNERKA